MVYFCGDEFMNLPPMIEDLTKWIEKTYGNE
eukprot:CAMPEP_0185614924 /NCGR_PEP_ID=MMETSP0436-20130131/33769_1 /TAXON_ID=626734 ORGANISM="Favella taraikaensis, Strain Fe Narragansett Bay" /NCGR_SAMPLE_ID=MMETSP0436 /ASSEMBLY_ACC=CAM_ASM_000390 /LENGTH=30 /DNA_ID= /DNA_START= /DNA_END= /DNA_ORIENTATION=